VSIILWRVISGGGTRTNAINVVISSNFEKLLQKRLKISAVLASPL